MGGDSYQLKASASPENWYYCLLPRTSLKKIHLKKDKSEITTIQN